jgi:hypothetical protein
MGHAAYAMHAESTDGEPMRCCALPLRLVRLCHSSAPALPPPPPAVMLLSCRKRGGLGGATHGSHLHFSLGPATSDYDFKAHPEQVGRGGVESVRALRECRGEGRAVCPLYMDFHTTALSLAVRLVNSSSLARSSPSGPAASTQVRSLPCPLPCPPPVHPPPPPLPPPQATTAA